MKPTPTSISADGIPFFEDKKDPTVAGKPVVERNVTNAIIWNRAKDEILVLEWPKFDWKTFIIGGIEGEEDPVICAQREAAEETGYNDIKFIAEIGKTKTSFYAAHKGVNRIANATCFLFELVSDAQQPVDPEETKNHFFKWIPRSEVAAFINIAPQQYSWEEALPFFK
ncbi:MAG: leuS [Candidatus Taylorbacteria bacterium]|nr:leuS [Candidatus Taylorbacteria bacterium]